MHDTSSELLQNEDVMTSRGTFRSKCLPGFIMLGLLVATPNSGFSVQTATAARPQTPRTGSQPRAQTPKLDTTTEELKHRYDLLTQAAESGDPNQVAEASWPVASLALRQMANLRMLQGAFPQAIELYRKSLEFEEAPDTHLNIAVAALRAGQLDEAVDQSALVLRMEPNNARAWHTNARAWMAKEDYRAAADSLARSLALESDVNVQFALGYSLLKLGEKPKAEQVFQQMIDSYGDRAIWHVVFGGGYRESKYPTDAIREFRRGIAMDPTVGHAHFFLALTLLEQNHWAQTEESMAEFREAVKQDPKDYFANFYLGAGESELKLFDESNRHLKTAAEVQADTPELWLYLGLNTFQQKNYPDSKKYLLKAIELTGKDEARNAFQIRRAYIALGRMAFTEGNKGEGDRYIERAKEMQKKSLAVSAESISETMAAGGMGQAAAVMPHAEIPKQSVVAEQAVVDPTAPMDPSVSSNTPLSPSDQEQAKQLENKLRQLLSSTFNDWGTADARLERYTLALERFQEAERWDNSTPGLMRNMGLAALRINALPEAIRALRVAVEVDPRDQLARSRLAMALFTANEYKEAVKVFGALNDASLNDPRLAYAFAYSLVKVNQPLKAGEVLNRLMSLAVPPEMLISIGDLYGVLEDYEHAIATYRKATNLDPSIARAHYKMGAALLRLNRPAEAVPELQAELRITPDDPDVQYNLAYALLETSQKEQAVALLRSLIEKHPDHPQAQYQLGKTLLDEGQLAEAVQHLEVAVKLDPDRDYIHYQLQTAYRRSGRSADADRESKIYRDIKTRKREQVVIPQPERKE